MKDRFGKELNIGDTVIISDSDGFLEKGYIIRFTKQRIVCKIYFVDGKDNFFTKNISPYKCAKHKFD